MCGISGVFGAGDIPAVTRMLATLRHRGPDDEACVGGTHFALGARRLSIIDVGGGRQPVSNETASIWAAQNGELYNFQERRRELIENGHSLHSMCDTEILPHLYEACGVLLPQRIDGMFAIAVWDDQQRLGLLARDRMGKKPLYYHRRARDGALYFASELKALLTLEGVGHELDLEALHHYLSYKHVPHPHSIFRDIRTLPPAHVLIYREGAEPEIRPYWQLRFDQDVDWTNATDDDITDRFLDLLRQGVRRRLMSDVPVGFFLSGGIDSSLSTALAAECSSQAVKTFTLSYAPGSSTPGKLEDRKWARWVAERYGTERYEETIDAFDYPGTFGSILRCFDEPFAGVVSTYFLSSLIARHVKVAVSGDGADELFGSYLSHRLAGPLDRYAGFLATGDASLIAPFEHDTSTLEALAGLPEWCWRSRLLVFSEEAKQKLYSPELAAVTAQYNTPNHIQSAFAKVTAHEPLNRVLEMEFKTIFPDQVLTFVDRLSMAHSLEVRTAYLDTDVVTFVASLPDRMKIRGGTTKYLLKQAALRYFPREMVERPKEGFLLPVTDWLVQLSDYVDGVLSEERLSRHHYFKVPEVQRLVADMRAYPGDHRRANRVLTLIAFQEWYDLYVP